MKEYLKRIVRIIYMNEIIKENKEKISLLQRKLYYIENKSQVNKNRKNYKRQAWADRKDNPKNKEKII